MGNQPGKIQNQNNRPKKNVHWKSAERPLPPGRPTLIPASEQQPDVVNLRWERPHLDGGSPITGYIVEHRRMGSPHWVRATPLLVQGCEVKISGLEPGWRYQFRVFAENIVGRSDPSELSDALTVTLQRNAITVPRFVDELQELHAVEDERIEFRVRVLGQPTPEINWFKDSYEIFSSRRTKIVNDGNSSVLIIHQVALTDEGEIKCTATNRAGHVATRAKLFVEAPPRIRLPRVYEDGIIVEAEDTLRLKVGIAGQPLPIVTWLYEGEVIQNDGRNEIETSEKNSLLKITNVQRSDRGEYSVKANNKLGVDIASFLVTVTSRPSPPGKVNLNISLGKSATLSWTIPEDDGGCMIGNYIVEYFRIGWNVWLKAATTRSLTVTLSDLIEGSEYKFRVKAENPYGVSDPSPESDTLFLPDPKRGIVKPRIKSELAADIKDKISVSQQSQKKHLQQENIEKRSKHLPLPAQLQNKSKRYLVDDENLHREMSYGTSNKSLKNEISVDRDMHTIEAKSNVKNKTKVNLHSNNKLPQSNPEAKISHQPIQQKIPTIKKPVEPPKIHKTSTSTQSSFSNTNANLTKYSKQNSNDSFKSAKNVPAVAIAIATSSLGERQPIMDTSTQENKRKTSPEKSVTTISEKTAKTAPKIKAPFVSLSPDNDKHDEVYTSNEFMLVVFDKHSNVNGKKKQDSFDFDLEDALSPPPISISSPDLASLEFNNLHIFPLRRSVSSTEILYERAMARFYEAVESEESQKNIKSAKKKLKSISEANNNIELKSEIEFSENMIENEVILSKNNSQDKLQITSNVEPIYQNLIETTPPPDSEEKFDDESDDYIKSHNLSLNSEEALGSDYTDSTVSSDNNSIEKFKQELIMRTRTPSPLELETYHPHNMSAGKFIPHSYEPSSTIMPKSILKQPSNEINVQYSNNAISENTSYNKNEHDEVNLISTNDNIPTINVKIETNDDLRTDIKPDTTIFNKIDTETYKESVKQENKKPETAMKETIKQENKNQENTTTNSEVHALVDHYSELVQQVSRTHKYHKPIYLDSDELRRVAEQADEENVDNQINNTSPKLNLSIEDIDDDINLSINNKPRLSISERGQMIHVRNTASNLALMQQQQMQHSAGDNDGLSRNIEDVAMITNSNITNIRTATDTKNDLAQTNQPRRLIKKRVISSRSRSITPSKRTSHEVLSESLLFRERNLNTNLSAKAVANEIHNDSDMPNQMFSDSETIQLEETHKKVRSTLSYYSDVLLFFLACYIYLFKDVRLVLPILALILYRHLGETIRLYVPKWLFFREK